MKVMAVNISQEKGTMKYPVEKITLNEKGILEDAHAGSWHRQVSLLSNESIEKFSHMEKAGRVFKYGEFAENITTSGIDLLQVKIKDILKIGSVVLEVTQIGKECHGGDCAVFKEVGKCVMPKEGIFTHVIQGGEIKPGDAIVHEKNPIKVAVITLSDRASQGEYEDKSGPMALEMLKNYFAKSHFGLETSYYLLPDEPALLQDMILKLASQKIDIIITTGGTGIGPRDITVDTLLPLLTRQIPGIMEAIRVKYSERIPSAVLSRSVAGMIGQTLVYTLPGSVKAVKEYMDEITKHFSHALLMISGINFH